MAKDNQLEMCIGEARQGLQESNFFFSTGFYSPLRTLAFLNGLLDPQTFGRPPWLEDQSNARHKEVMVIKNIKKCDK
jgi:hypothetical protein